MPRSAAGNSNSFDKMTRLNAMVIAKQGSFGRHLAAELMRARLRATLTGDTARARAIADSGLAVARWDSLGPMDRPYLPMLQYLASVGDVARGDTSRAMVSGYAGALQASRFAEHSRRAWRARVGVGQRPRGVAIIQVADVRGCERCFYPRYGRAFDAINKPDSARIW